MDAPRVVCAVDCVQLGLHLFTMIYRNIAIFKNTTANALSPINSLVLVKYKELGLYICKDCLRQNYDIKTSSLKFRIEFEAENNFPVNTATYFSVIHDQIIKYNPFKSGVRKM